MISKSTMYAVAKNGYLVEKGSAASMRKLRKQLKKENPANIIQVCNTPSGKVGDWVGLPHWLSEVEKESIRANENYWGDMS